MTTPPLDLAALRALAEKATPGPYAWRETTRAESMPNHLAAARLCGTPPNLRVLCADIVCKDDAAYIVAACNALPALLDEVERLRDALDGLLLLMRLPGESFTDAFERVASAYQRDTGHLAPGKDRAAAAGGHDDREERRAEFDAWIAAKVAKAVSARRAAEGGAG